MGNCVAKISLISVYRQFTMWSWWNEQVNFEEKVD